MTTAPPLPNQSILNQPLSAVEIMQRELDALGKRDRMIARYFIDHAEEIPFLSAGEVAEALEVSGAAMTRFAQRVGFEGYPHLQRAIRQDLRATLGMRAPPQNGSMVAQFWQSERVNLETLQGIPELTLQAMARSLAQARSVHFIGARSSYGLAITAAAILSSFRPQVLAHASELLLSSPAQLLDLGADDVALVLTMRRYSRATAAATRAMAGRGVQILLISDQGATPLAKLAAQHLHLPTQGSAVIASLGPFLSMISLLTTLVAQELAGGHLKAIEKLYEEFGVYEY